MGGLSDLKKAFATGVFPPSRNQPPSDEVLAAILGPVPEVELRSDANNSNQQLHRRDDNAVESDTGTDYSMFAEASPQNSGPSSFAYSSDTNNNGVGPLNKSVVQTLSSALSYDTTKSQVTAYIRDLEKQLTEAKIELNTARAISPDPIVNAMVAAVPEAAPVANAVAVHINPVLAAVPEAAPFVNRMEEQRAEHVRARPQLDRVSKPRCEFIKGDLSRCRNVAHFWSKSANGSFCGIHYGKVHHKERFSALEKCKEINKRKRMDNKYDELISEESEDVVEQGIVEDERKAALRPRSEAADRKLKEYLTAQEAMQ